MVRSHLVAYLALVMGVVDATAADSPAAPVASNSAEAVAQTAARLIAAAIPHEYERHKDWGRTKRITTGLRSSGNFFDFDIHRRKTAVSHGVWKHYRVSLVEPEQHLAVRIENLRSEAAGQFACTLYVTAKLHGWARAKVYDRGIHLIAVEAEADTSVRLWLDVRIALERVAGTYLSGVGVRPEVTAARLKLDHFHLTRVSDVKGPLVEELGDGLRHVIEDELDGPKLVAKLNRSIEKRRDRLQLKPESLLGIAP